MSEQEGVHPVVVTSRVCLEERRVKMFLLRGCPRCGGDMSVVRDHDGTYLDCVQCGFCLHLDCELGDPPQLVPSSIAVGPWSQFPKEGYRRAFRQRE